MKSIDFLQAKQITDENPNALYLDVREENEYVTGHAIGALLFPLDTINEQTATEKIPSKQTPLLVYCRSGRRALEACRILEAMGYEQVYLLGSLVSWPYGLEYGI